MRSELVFSATAHVPNRFLLTGLASKGVRKLHRQTLAYQIRRTMYLYASVAPIPWQLWHLSGINHPSHCPAQAKLARGGTSW